MSNADGNCSTLHPIYAFIVATWVVVAAYTRKAIGRDRMAAYALLSLGIGFVVYKSIVVLTRSKMDDLGRLFVCLLLTLWLTYFAASITFVIWAHKARSVIEPRGFPIEPPNSVAPKDSESV